MLSNEPKYGEYLPFWNVFPYMGKLPTLPNECSTLNYSFSKGIWGYTSFCIFYRWRKSTFFFTPTIPLALKFSQYLNSSATAYFIDGAIFGAVNKHRPVANLSKILEVIWSTTYNLAKKHAHKLISPL